MEAITALTIPIQSLRMGVLTLLMRAQASLFVAPLLNFQMRRNCKTPLHCTSTSTVQSLQTGHLSRQRSCPSDIYLGMNAFYKAYFMRGVLHCCPRNFASQRQSLLVRLYWFPPVQ